MTNTEMTSTEATSAEATSTDTTSTADLIRNNRHELRVLHLLAGIFFVGCTVAWLLQMNDNLSGQVFAVSAASTAVLIGVVALVAMARRGASRN